jgi:hypothetical protein
MEMNDWVGWRKLENRDWGFCFCVLWFVDDVIVRFGLMKVDYYICYCYRTVKVCLLNFIIF